MLARMARRASQPAIPPGIFRRAREFGYRALWEVDERALPQPRRAIVSVARLAFVTIEAFFRERLQIRAAALAFFTLLSIVPSAALIFSIAKAVGAYDAIVNRTVRPFIADTFEAPPGEQVPPAIEAMRSTVENVLDLVAGTDVFGLGVLGFAFLLLTIGRLVRGAEEAFDTIWASPAKRRLALRVPAYVAAAIFTPTALTFASTLTAARHTELLTRLIPIPYLQTFVGFVAPPVLVCIGILPLYIALPSARVRNRSALIGAIIGGLGWYALQVLHVRFQIGVARTNALYSGFGALPLFLVWLHLSWVWILLGAQVAAAHQNAPTLKQLARASLDDHLEQQAVALRAMIELAHEKDGVRLRDLARELGVAVEPLRVVLDALAGHGLIASRDGPYDPIYSAAVDPDSVRVAAVLEALRRRASYAEMPWDDDDRSLDEVLKGLRAAVETSDHNRTIGELRRASKKGRASDPG
jgi:membrane protein